jgi:hypothetical protein
MEGVTSYRTDRKEDAKNYLKQRRFDSFEKFKNVKDPLAKFQEIYTYNMTKQTAFRLYSGNEVKVDPKFDEIIKRTGMENDIQAIAKYLQDSNNGKNPMFGEGQYLLVNVLAIEPKEGSGTAYDVQFSAIPTNGEWRTGRAIFATSDENRSLASDAAVLIAMMKK